MRKSLLPESAGKEKSQETRIIVRYQSPSSLFTETPGEAGRAEDVIRCVANLVQKGRVKSIFYNSSHVLHKKGTGYTYEVRFIRAGRSRKRRFTVYKLSGNHAKSDCYQVTDPHGEYIVVKIPPQPITAMDAYLEAVVHERILAKKLAESGVNVVVPCVSPVMRHLHKFGSAEKMSAGELEDAYMQLLRTSRGNGFAEYFKIGGTFVFFLQFLENPFLGDVIREFYHQELLANIKKDHIVRDLDLISNRERQAFLDGYKNFAAKQAINEIFDGLIETYTAFSSKIDSPPAEFSHSRKKDLFIAKIVAGLAESSALTPSSPDQSTQGLPAERPDEQLDLSMQNSPALLRYLEMLDQEVTWRAFKYSAKRIEKIGNNLLALLAKLAEMDLVLRDLKVDNLFVTDVENMELGVIDLETGKDIGKGNVKKVVPAGMPGNMTVSNLLFASQLQSIYGRSNVEKILHLQDWYATVAMIFEAIIGRTLFSEARDYIAQLFVKIDRIVASNYRDYLRNNPGRELSPDMIEQFFMLSDEEIKGHTWQFFALAKRDLKKKSLTYSSRLKEISFCLPEVLRRKILHALDIHLQRIQHDYRGFKLTDISGGSLALPATKMHDLRNNLLFKEKLLETFRANPSVSEDKLVELAAEIDAYQRCLALKRKDTLLQKKRGIVKQTEISAFALFPILLDYITEIMCRDEWHGHRVKLIPGGHGMKRKQTIAAVADGQATLFAPGDESVKLTESRHTGIGGNDRCCPSLMLSTVANMGDDEKTLRNSFLLNYLQAQRSKTQMTRLP